MKIIQKIPLCLFTLAAILTWSTASATDLEIDFHDGTSIDTVITGKVNLVGFAASDELTLSGSITDDVKISRGNIKTTSSTSFGADIIMNGGSLETTTAMSLPTLVIDADSTLTADAAATLTGMGGVSKLTVAGVGAITPDDLSAATNAVDVSGIVHVGATGSLLPSGAVTVKNAGLVKLMGVVADCIPGAMKVESGGAVEVDASLAVPAVGAAASGDLFGTLRFDTGSRLKLGNGADWGRAVTIGSYS